MLECYVQTKTTELSLTLTILSELNMFEKEGYELIDLNFEFEDLIVKTFEETVREHDIPRGTRQVGITPPPLEVPMEILARIVHRDYTTPIVEKRIGLNLIPTYCYSRKYFKGSTLALHIDRDACEISLTYCISGPEWKFNIGNKAPLITRKGNGVIYRGCEIEHGRLHPSSGEIIQVFNHWVISAGSGGTRFKSAYDDDQTKDFYIAEKLRRMNNRIEYEKN